VGGSNLEQKGKNMLEKLRLIKLIVLDFDGTLTDGYVYCDQNGIEMVCCSRKDGLGIEMLKEAGLQVVILSKETNPVVAVRCAKMGIPTIQGIATGMGKVEHLLQYLREVGISLEQVLYMGDDINDIPVLDVVGVPATVADGHSLVIDIVRKRGGYIAQLKGGEHAVRELAEAILIAQGFELRV